MRYGRGGRIHLDRRNTVFRSFSRGLPRSNLFALDEEDNLDVDDEQEDMDHVRQLEDQWKYDSDDGPTIGPQGSDEQDRVLVDDYDVKYVFFPA